MDSLFRGCYRHHFLRSPLRVRSSTGRGRGDEQVTSILRHPGSVQKVTSTVYSQFCLVVTVDSCFITKQQNICLDIMPHDILLCSIQICLFFRNCRLQTDPNLPQKQLNQQNTAGYKPSSETEHNSFLTFLRNSRTQQDLNLP